MKFDEEDKRFFLRVGIIFLVAMAVTFVATNQLSEKDIRTVNVSGEYTYKLSPDFVSFTVSLEERGSSPEDVQEKLNRNSGNALEVIKRWGGEYTVKSYNIYPEYNYEGKEINSFKGNLTADVKVYSNGKNVLEKTTAAVNELIKYHKVAAVYDIRFDVTEETKETIKLEALGKASQDAFKKASSIAKENNARVRVKEITEEYYYNPYTEYKSSTDASAGSYPPIELQGEAKITARVRAIYIIY